MEKFQKVWLIVSLLANGAAIIILEILGTRIIAPYFGTTLYVWTALIVTTLLALAVGYYFGGHLADKKPDWKIFYLLFFIASLIYLIIPLADAAILSLTSDLGILWGPLVASIFLFFIPLGILGMITPFAVRLHTKQIERVGTNVGNFYAVSTAGSLLGALVTAYLLIPNFKIPTIIIFSAIGLMLVSVIWFMANKKMWSEGAGMIAIIFILILLVIRQQPAEAALEEVQSFYGDTEVKILSTDLICIVVNNIPQSCFNPDNDGSAYPYTRLMARGLEQVNSPERILSIGDGGGLLTREILKKYDVRVDAVDIDAKIFELGEKYLYFTDDPRVNKIVADGRNFLRESSGNYDSILIDAFTDSVPAAHLFTREAFKLTKSKMTPAGVLVLNTFGFNKGKGTEVLKSLYKTLLAVFNDVYVSPSGETDQEEREFYNFIIYASDNDLERLDRVFSVAITNDTPIITDNYNPLDLYSLPASEELINLYALGNNE